MNRLHGTLRKLSHANEHIKVIDRLVRAFLTSRPYKIATKRSEDTRLVYYVAEMKETPEELALIAGDAIQNLRSALDHLAYQLVDVGTNGAGPFKHVYFPIYDNFQKYQNGKLGKIKGMRQEATAAIDAVKPYKGGNDILWLLHSLSMIERHRLLVTVGSTFESLNFGPILMAEFRKLWPEDEGNKQPVPDLFLGPADKEFPLKVGTELYIDAPGAQQNDKIQFRFTVAFGEPGAAGKPLVGTLRQMSSVVEATIRNFEPLLK